MIALLSQVRPEWFKRTQGRFSWRGFAVFGCAALVAVVIHGLMDQVFPYLALALIFGGLTLWVLWDASFVTRPLNSHAFYLISRLAYGMYLNHIFIIIMARSVVAPALVSSLGNSPPAFFLGLFFTVATSVLVATATFVLVEHPFLQMRERWLRKKSRIARATDCSAPLSVRIPHPSASSPATCGTSAPRYNRRDCSPHWPMPLRDSTLQTKDLLMPVGLWGRPPQEFMSATAPPSLESAL